MAKVSLSPWTPGPSQGLHPHDLMHICSQTPNARDEALLTGIGGKHKHTSHRRGQGVRGKERGEQRRKSQRPWEQRGLGPAVRPRQGTFPSAPTASPSGGGHSTRRPAAPTPQGNRPGPPPPERPSPCFSEALDLFMLLSLKRGLGKRQQNE